jgi:hypothetical protein
LHAVHHHGAFLEQGDAVAGTIVPHLTEIAGATDMSFIRYAAALAATISLISASEASAQGAIQFGGTEMVSVSMVLDGGAAAAAPAADAGEPARGAARRGSGNPHPAASATLLARMGCAEGEESGGQRARVTVGMDACRALGQYGQPSSTTFSDFGHTELVTMVWGNVGGSYGVHVAAVTYKDHPLTHQAGKQAEIGNWRITRHFGMERR